MSRQDVAASSAGSFAWRWWGAIALLGVTALAACAQTQPWRVLDRSDPSAANLPATPHEMRALWVASVDNIDWPSTRTLTARQQQDEITKILDLAKSLNFNALVLQVRPSCDALYPSALEPWSEYLTGRSGVPPQPAYDPLRLWVDGAHARGIQLHAWINPFRARHPKARQPDAPSHISHAAPHLVRKYTDYLWMDPGEPEVIDRTLSVVRDLVTRYDIDAIHIDDYFYPYPKDKVPFDDDASWRRYKAMGGTLADRDEWRRSNVDLFVERMYREVKAVRPTVLVGISPFGIWRPGNPPGVQSMDPFIKLHADSRKWLQQGWLDYIAPQLYWPVDSKQQPFEPLLKWWVAQNVRDRHVWPGLYISRVGSREGAKWNSTEIARQIDLTRRTPGSGGAIMFSVVALLEHREDLVERVRSLYSTPAIVPASPWLDATPPGTPVVSATFLSASQSSRLQLKITPPPGEEAFRYVVGCDYGEATWRCEILPSGARDHSVSGMSISGKPLRRVAVSCVDRLGNESAKVVVAR